jgi:hypothetical protein
MQSLRPKKGTKVISSNMKLIQLKFLSVALVMGILFIASSIILLADNANTLLPPQGPEWVLPKSTADKAEQQRFLTDAYAREQAQQESEIVSRQNEIIKIFSKDPWRKINGSTNYVGDDGWQQFQGKVLSIEPIGILFQGSFGKVLSITTETDKDADLVTTHGEVSNESEMELQKRNTRTTSTQSTHVTKIQHEKLYGDDFFLVVNFPYPIKEGLGYERLMAYDTGYITYTNGDKRALTVRKLDYGLPCIKIWSAEEIAAAYKAAEAKRAAIEAERKAQRDLLEAQAEAERARLEAERAEKLAAIEAEKVKKFEHQKDLADKGDMFALRRIGEFYRDGYGVKKDPAKANEYFAKADEAFEVEAERVAKESALNEQAAQKQKFLINLELADKHDNALSALFVEKCYREGIGVEKDLTKADEYHAKAVSFGLPQRPNTSPQY